MPYTRPDMEKVKTIFKETKEKVEMPIQLLNKLK